jgi:hypothetical protein
MHKRSICQDRLGTNIGKFETKRAFIAGAGAGKLNRKALPPSTQPGLKKLPAFDEASDQTQERKLPADFYEQKILAIWCGKTLFGAI